MNYRITLIPGFSYNLEGSNYKLDTNTFPNIRKRQTGILGSANITYLIVSLISVLPVRGEGDAKSKCNNGTIEMARGY